MIFIISPVFIEMLFIHMKVKKIRRQLNLHLPAGSESRQAEKLTFRLRSASLKFSSEKFILLGCIQVLSFPPGHDFSLYYTKYK